MGVGSVRLGWGLLGGGGGFVRWGWGLLGGGGVC